MEEEHRDSEAPRSPWSLSRWEMEHWSVKVAVRLVCVFGCSFLSKEDLTLQRDLILSFFFFFFF